MFAIRISLLSGLCLVVTACVGPRTPETLAHSNMKKSVVWEGTASGGVRAIQLTDLRPAEEPEVAVLSQMRIRFLARDSYEVVEEHLLRTKDGKVVALGMNPELVDANRDGAYEVLQRGNKFSEVGLIGHSGHLLWSFQPDPNFQSNELMAADVDGDGRQEFYSSGFTGLYRLNPEGEIEWRYEAPEHASLPWISDVEVLPDPVSGEKRLLALYDNTLVVLNAGGEVLRSFRPGYRFNKYEVVEWNGVPLIMTGYPGGVIVMMDSTGETVATFGLGGFRPNRETQATSVRFEASREAYLAILAHSKGAVRNSQLTILSPEHEVVYREVLGRTRGLLALKKPGTDAEVLLVGDGPHAVLEYRMEGE